MDFNYKILDMDIRKTQFTNEMSEKQVCTKIGISRATLWRMGLGKPVTMEVFCKMAAFTKMPVERYFTKSTLDDYCTN